MTPEVWARVISAAVVPVVMISACGLLCLAFYNRLTAVLVRIRAFQGESLKEQEDLLHRPAAGDTQRRARRLTRESVEVLQRQMNRLLYRARLIQRTLLALLSAIASLLLCSFGAGIGAFWAPALYAAVPCFFAGLLCMLAGIACAMLEARIALEPVELGQEFVERLARTLPEDPEGPPACEGPTA
ncbi:MAG: DUF2721 domain-containing protein [Burkholderiales bacterium]|nr:DUF2721 domain-containing protein [Burkholderiales bacterium]